VTGERGDETFTVAGHEGARKRSVCPRRTPKKSADPPARVREWECMTLDELGQDKRAAILAIAAKHGVQRVRVFGSFARGDARADSDLDLLIDAGPRTPPWFPGGLLVDLEEELGRKVDVAEESALHPLIRDRVLHEAIPL